MLGEYRQAEAHDHQTEQRGSALAKRLPEALFQAGSGEPGQQERQYARYEQRDVHDLVEVPGGESTEGDHLAMGEVGDSRGAVDQRESDGGHGQEQAQADAVDREWQNPVDRAGAVAGVHPEGEQQRLLLTRPDHEGERGALLVGEGHPVGERINDQLRCVLTLGGQFQEVGTVIVGHDGADLLARRVRNHDLHAADR